MSPPLTVAWTDQSFHVCGGEEMSCRRERGEERVEVLVGLRSLFKVLLCSGGGGRKKRVVTCSLQREGWLFW